MDTLAPATRALVGALYTCWAHGGGSHRADWLDLFRLAERDATQREILAERGAALSMLIGAPVEGEDAQHGAILAVQTAAAIVARLVALRVTEQEEGQLAALATGADDALLVSLAGVGATLDARGVVDLLGGDPFDWYLAGMDAAGVGALRAVVAEVATLVVPTGGEDLFAALTQAIVPAAVRHALGEFYTPGWIADIVVDTALRYAGAPPDWRGVDPCCGSGAFLLALARRVLADTEGRPREERLRAVLDRVAGVDLHPLAVLTARVNLLVVIAPLLETGARVRIAVHRGDATRPGNHHAAVGAGRFTLVVGNPPWVDWKRLPPAQRATLRENPVARNLLSGDGLVGGVSLNVCAVVAHAAADAWLADGGVMGLLMPRSLAFQASYASFRAMRRADGAPRRVVAFDDWSAVGHPFAPVTERFLTWYVGDGAAEPDDACVPVTHYRTRLGTLTHFAGVAAPVGATNAYTWAADRAELRRFAAVAGDCAYVGREGVEFYPQEVWLFEVLGPAADGCVRVRNFQGDKSRYRIPVRELELEAEWLHPLVKGVDVGRFSVATSGLVVPFPYADGERFPVPMATLRARAPRLAAWLTEHAPLLAAQTPYNARIVGRPDAEPHALARVGRYSFARAWVAFRDNTRWGATVVTAMDTEWGGARLPRFQNHAVSMCERADGSWITEDEAHYVCAALNAPLVARFLAASSDARSFKIRPPVRVPLYEPDASTHRALAALSRRGHAGENVDAELDGAYLAAVGRGGG
ncbi:MAG: N-6 DNA methylase [Myxococcota bacterium]